MNLLHLLAKTNAFKNLETFSRYPLKRPYFYVALAALAFMLVLPGARAVDPPPSGGYPNENTALGQDALFNLVISSLGGNTASGFEALYSDTTGADNTAVGVNSLHSNTTGDSNTAIGMWSLYSNTTGQSNIGIGGFALVGNTTGYSNVAIGDEALEDNTTAFDNTAIGTAALTFSTTGIRNTAVGGGAVAFNTSGSENTGLGTGALNFNSTGSGNTAVGDSALSANTDGSGNIALGQLAGSVTTGSNNIDIGNDGVADESGVIRIGTRRTHGKTFIQGINKVTVSGGVAVVVNNNGQLGTMTSSARYKEAIKPMKDASEAILSLQPVTFRYKKEYDSEAIPQFGLIAEQVAQVDPDLVARDEEGKPYTVRYEAVNAMLLNEFLKEHRRVEKQAKKIEQLESALLKQADDLRAINARLQSSTPTQRLVENR
ncbi:MAG TPA: tail fiber domain-containing protein [Chthoniobacterales bacterium]